MSPNDTLQVICVLLRPEQYAHQIYVLEENKRPKYHTSEQKLQEQGGLTPSLDMNINIKMMLMGSCLYLCTFKLNNNFVQINTNTNGTGLPTGFFLFHLF